MTGRINQLVSYLEQDIEITKINNRNCSNNRKYSNNGNFSDNLNQPKNKSKKKDDQQYSKSDIMSSVSLQNQHFPLKTTDSSPLHHAIFGYSNFQNNQRYDNMYRQGIVHNHGKNNISLLYSFLYCVKQNFPMMPFDTKVSYIHQLKKKLSGELSSKRYYTVFRYRKLGYKIVDVQQAIHNLNDDSIVLKYLSDYFNLNILVFNFNTNKIDAYYSEDGFNIYKTNIFISFKNASGKKYYEPIIGINRKSRKTYFTYNYHNHNLNYLLNNPNMLNIGIKGKKCQDRTFEIETDIETICEHQIEINNGLKNKKNKKA